MALGGGGEGGAADAATAGEVDADRTGCERDEDGRVLRDRRATVNKCLNAIYRLISLAI